MDEIESIDDLRRILGNKSVSDVLNRYFFEKGPICFGGNKDIIYQLKKSLSKHFQVHIKEIDIVGSGRLGFSLNPKKLGQLYNDKSDIDLVIVSDSLFDFAWHELLRLDMESYLLNEVQRQFLAECFQKIPYGIISPDLLPRKMSFSKVWWEIFVELSGHKHYEGRKIRGRLFKNWWFVEKYYSIQLAKLSQQGE